MYDILSRRENIAMIPFHFPEQAFDQVVRPARIPESFSKAAQRSPKSSRSYYFRHHYPYPTSGRCLNLCLKDFP